MSPYLNYTTNALSRCAEKRAEAAWIEEILQNPKTQIWVFCNGQPLIDSASIRPVSLHPDQARNFIAQDATYVAAGTLNETQPVLALDISKFDWPDKGVDTPPASPVRENNTHVGVFSELRPFVSGMDGQIASILAYARSLFIWHGQYRFCGSCGAPAWPQEHGHSRKCENPSCGAQTYPRLNPAVIMLVTAADQALLAHNVTFPAGLHSVLAGYVEHGESLEQAVAREVKEEVGLDVDRVTYISSQPWPYSNSLMLGFHAEIDGDVPPEIKIDETEIDSAAWWTRDSLRAQKDNPDFLIPSRDAIARRLLDRWLLADPSV